MDRSRSGNNIHKLEVFRKLTLLKSIERISLGLELEFSKQSGSPASGLISATDLNYQSQF